MAEEEFGLESLIGGIFGVTFFVYSIKYLPLGLYGYIAYPIIINAVLTAIGYVSIIGSFKLGQFLERKDYFNGFVVLIYSIIGSILTLIGTLCCLEIILTILAGFFTNPLSITNTPGIWANNITHSFWFNVIINLIWSIVAIGITSRFINYIPAYLGFVLVNFIGGSLLGHPVLGLIVGIIYGGIATLIIYLLDSSK